MNSLTVREWDSLERAHVGCESKSVPAGRIRVRVRYAGVGFADLMAVAGKYPLAPKRPFSPGYELFGTVAQIGTGVDGAAPPELQPGRRVVAMLPQMGAYRAVVDLSPQWLVPVPDGVDDETAAQLPLNYLTALALIEYTAKLRAGQSLLVHGAGGGVGTAVLELARLLGISAFGTASIAKHDLVRTLGGTPIDYTTGDWDRQLLSLAPAGFDAVFDSFGGEQLRRSWRLVAKGGALVSYGFFASTAGGVWPMISGALFLQRKNLLPNGKRALFCGTPSVIAKDPTWYRRSLERLLTWAGDGRINPHRHGVLPSGRAEEAHRMIAERQVQGKILLEF